MKPMPRLQSSALDWIMKWTAWFAELLPILVTKDELERRIQRHIREDH